LVPVKFTLELVPLGCHRRNAAEVATRNFKAHFLSVLAGTAPTFPPSLWDKLLPQTEITLNLLRQSNATPTVSAYAHLIGPFDYNKMPLAPMGCEVQVHEKIYKRGSWTYHCVDGWYLSTSPEHYRVHRCHIKSTRSERLSDTVQFQPPALSTWSRVKEAATTKPQLTAPKRSSSRLLQPTKSSMQRNMKQALSAQLQSPKGREEFITQYKLMEKEKEKAMMVLDEESGQLLKYKDLLRHPKYKKEWSIAAADEFGCLAQGVGGRIKKPTDTIRFIREQDVPKNR
jgi:hypothetical protein